MYDTSSIENGWDDLTWDRKFITFIKTYYLFIYKKIILNEFFNHEEI